MSVTVFVCILATGITLAVVTVLGARVEGWHGSTAALLTVVLLTPMLFATLVAVIWVAATGFVILGGSFAP